jgi:hypothetical protein
MFKGKSFMRRMKRERRRAVKKEERERLEREKELKRLTNKVRLYEILHPGFDRKEQQCRLCLYKFDNCPENVPRYENYCIEWVKYVP